MSTILKRYVDCYNVIFFSINLVVAVLIGDMTLSFVSESCSVGVPYYCSDRLYTGIWPPKIMAQWFFNHMYQNDPLGYARPTWYMVTQWIGIIFWLPFYPIAIYAFIKGDNRIRIPCIMYCTAMIVMLTMIISEGLIGEYQRDNAYWSVVIENLPWIITIPLLLFRMIMNETPFDLPDPKRRNIYKSA